MPPVSGSPPDPGTGAAAGPDPKSESGGAPPQGPKGSRLLPRRPAGRPLHPVTPWRRAWAPVAALCAFAGHNLQNARDWLSALTPGWLLVALVVLLLAAAAYGFFSWWFTSYLVTDTELRIRTGLFFRRAAHIRLDRIQAVDVGRPLLARIAGVAKLRLDVVGAESKDELAFLGEQEAVALRAELLARAAGMAPDAAAEAQEAPAGHLLRVPPRTLAVALLLSGSGWAALVGAVVAGGLLYLATDNVFPALAVLLPLGGLAWAGTVGRFLREYDWTVAGAPDGLRLDSGLLDRVHETVPPGRVQSVRAVEPLLWRWRGWVRVELEVAGAPTGGGSGGNSGRRGRGGVLIPVAPWPEAARVLAQVLPGTELDAARAALRPAPRRARWCAPLWWRGYGHGVTGTVFVTGAGLLRRRTTLVPHAKVQSVRLTQGVWARRMGLARVSVDHGANGAAAAHLRDEQEAYGILRAQAERSRTGRRTAGPERWLT